METCQGYHHQPYVFRACLPTTEDFPVSNACATVQLATSPSGNIVTCQLRTPKLDYYLASPSFYLQLRTYLTGWLLCYNTTNNFPCQVKKSSISASAIHHLTYWITYWVMVVSVGLPTTKTNTLWPATQSRSWHHAEWNEIAHLFKWTTSQFQRLWYYIHSYTKSSYSPTAPAVLILAINRCRGLVVFQ